MFYVKSESNITQDNETQPYQLISRCFGGMGNHVTNTLTSFDYSLLDRITTVSNNIKNISLININNNRLALQGTSGKI